MKKIDFKGIKPGHMSNYVLLLSRHYVPESRTYKTLAFYGAEEGFDIIGGADEDIRVTTTIRLDKVQVVASVAEKEFKYGYGSNNARRLHGLKANRRVKRRDKRRVK